MSPSNATTVANDDENTVTVLRTKSTNARLRPSSSSTATPGMICVAPGFDGFAVLRRQRGEPPASLGPKPYQLAFPWYKIIAIVKDDQAASIQVRRENSEVLVIDFKLDFDPTAENLTPYAHDYLVAHYDGRPVEVAALRTAKPLGLAGASLVAASTGAPVAAPDGVPGDCPIVTALSA
jgi:hypothetical protein